jgi:hypothetical protein
MARPYARTADEEARLRQMIGRARTCAKPFAWKELEYLTGLSRMTLWNIWRGRPRKARRIILHLRPGQRRADAA